MSAHGRQPQSDRSGRSRLRPGRGRALAALALLVAGFLSWTAAAPPASADHWLPTPLVTVVPGDGSVTVSWEHPEPHLVNRSLLMYKQGGSFEGPLVVLGDVSKNLPVPARGTNVISGLTNGTTYVIHVTAAVSLTSPHINAAWASVPVTAGSPQAPVVQVAPLNLDVDLDVTWDEPEDNGAAITSYDLQYRKSGAETWTDDGVTFPGGHTRRAWIGGLEEGVRYDVRARAHNARGAGPWSRVANGAPVVAPAPSYRGAATTVGFASAAYSATEGGAVSIELRLASAQPEPVRLQVLPVYGGAASHESDYSLGECLPGERSCDFGVGILSVEIPVGETAYRYDIRTHDDHRVEGDETFTLRVHAISRNAELGDRSRAAITITDNDQAGVVVSEERITVDEDTSGSYTVTLTSQPADWVRIYAESAFACKVNVSPGFVEFGRHNWNQPQTFVHVRSWNDYDAADEEVVITHRVAAGSWSAEYRSVDVAPVTVAVTDQHSPAVIVEGTSLQASVGGTARYRVYLNADPSPIYGENPADCYDYDRSHTVTIEATSSDTDVATVSPASVTFTADDYDPKYFVVTALSPGDVAITHAVSGTDPDYTDGTIIIQSVAVTAPALQQALEPTTMPQRATTGRVATPLPGPVPDLELSATANSLTVGWSAPRTGDPPTRYIVHIKPMGGGKGATRTPKAKKTSVTFGNLEAGQAYKVFVRARNEAGKGPRTYAVITLPDVPAGLDQGN